MPIGAVRWPVKIVLMRYRLRTLLILLAIGPPVLAGTWAAGKSAIDAILESDRLPRQTDVFAPSGPGVQLVILDNDEPNP